MSSKRFWYFVAALVIANGALALDSAVANEPVRADVWSCAEDASGDRFCMSYLYPDCRCESCDVDCW